MGTAHIIHVFPGFHQYVRKGEIACNKQFFPFSHNVFQSCISLVRQNAAFCGNGLNFGVVWERNEVSDNP